VSEAKQVGKQYGELDTMPSPMITEGNPHVIQHMLDQSRFPGDLKTKLLKKIERIDKPNVEVMLNILRLCQKNQGCNCGPEPTVNNVNTGHIGGKKKIGQKDVSGPNVR